MSILCHRPGMWPAFRRVLSGGVMLMTISAFTSPTLMAQVPIRFEQYTLDNGLTVILHEDHSAPIAAVVVMYHVGSKNEKPKRTGFAHLFEHMMFQGSQHVHDEEHFRLLQEVGANVNGTTSNDRTNYFEVLPSHYLELALYLESDRMGFLLPAMTQSKLDNQRDVVKNERRQRVDNQPYGTAGETIDRMLYPENHPYRWPVIGHMEDLTAASLQDVTEFFSIYYAPNNAVVSIAGDIDPAQTKSWIRKYFGDLPRGTPISRPDHQELSLDSDRRAVLEDRVQLPRLYLTWPGPRMQTREDAVMDVLTDILSVGKNSRLYKSLVYDRQIAQSAIAYQNGAEIAGEAAIVVTANPGKNLTEMEQAVEEVLSELLRNGVTEREIQTSLNAKEAQLVNNRATVLGKANALATYQTLTGDAENVNQELERFRDITPEEVLAVARKVYGKTKVVLSVVPLGKPELAAQQQILNRKEGRE
jgi:zinc protease